MIEVEFRSLAPWDQGLCHSRAMADFTPSFNDASDLLRLRGAPVLHIVCGVAALLAVASLVFRFRPTDAVAALAAGLDLPEATIDSAMRNTHPWVAADPRGTVLTWAITLGAIALAAVYVRNLTEVHRWTKEQREARDELGRLPYGLLDGEGRYFWAPSSPVTAAMTTEVEAAGKKWLTAVADANDIAQWGGGINVRLAALAWLPILVALERGGWAPVMLEA